ncbi:MAG: TIM barrel protein [Thermomicrobiales bacterium]|nr:TIM barrel protein [Thermomicrobiales bacterium]
MSETGADARMRAASAPINWGVYRLDPDNPDPDALLDEIAAAGYVGCELGPLGYFAATPEEVATQFGRRGLALASAFVATHLGQPLTPEFAREFETVATLLREGGATTILLSDGFLPERARVVSHVEQSPETWWSDAEWAQALANIQTLMERADRFGLRLAFHPHVATHVESEREIDRLLEMTAADAMPLCLDTGHMLIGGADPAAILEAHGERVVHVHAKDVRGAPLARLRAGEIDYSTAVGEGIYCDLGDGVVDWGRIVAGLAAAGYADWLVVEQDRRLSPEQDAPFASMRRNRAFVAERFGV